MDRAFFVVYNLAHFLVFVISPSSFKDLLSSPLQRPLIHIQTIIYLLTQTGKKHWHNDHCSFTAILFEMLMFLLIHR